MVKSKKLIERTRARMESRKVEGEQGSLILDILIGMAIFALIAIIAVSAISQYRERAYEQGSVSDAKAAALVIEANYTDDQAYPATVTKATLLADGVNLTKGVDVVGYAADGGSFVLCMEHTSGTDTKDAWAVYNSVTGGLEDSGRGEGCDAADAVAALAATS